MKYILATLLVLNISTTFGQLAENDTSKWNYSLNSSLSYSKGNSNRLITRNKITVKHLNNNFGYYSGNDYYYVSFSEKKYYHDFKSVNYLYLYPRKKNYHFLMVIPEFSYKRKINYRQQNGIGSSFVLLRKPAHIFKVTATAVHQYTNYETSVFNNPNYGGGQNEIHEFLVCGRFYGAHSIEKIRSSISYEFWWQQSLRDEYNKRFSELEIAFYLTQRLALTLELSHSYENIVPDGVKKNDFRLTQGLKYSVNR